MAEFINKRPDLNPTKVEDDGFGNMGKPIPSFRKEAGVTCCKEMGMTDMAKVTACVSAMSAALERDKPYEAMEAAGQFLDLTGSYRLMSVLLITPKPHLVGPAATIGEIL